MIDPTTLVARALTYATNCMGEPLSSTSLHAAILTEYLLATGCTIAGISRPADPEAEPYCNHDAPAVRDLNVLVCECGAIHHDNRWFNETPAHRRPRRARR